VENHLYNCPLISCVTKEPSSWYRIFLEQLKVTHSADKEVHSFMEVLSACSQKFIIEPYPEEVQFISSEHIFTKMNFI
jgi:hypothetical protein